VDVKLLRKVKKMILAQPKRFDMDSFGRRVPAEEGGPRCGTVACIAGWAVILKKKVPRNPHAEMPPIGREDGMEALDIDYDQAARLFYDEEWPEQFRDYVADGSKESACIAARRIEHFIKTKGAD